MMKNLEKEVEEALMRDVELSEDEYRAKNEKADLSTKTRGVKGKAALTESTRHKRIQMNFYGTVLNILVSLLAETSETNRLLRYMLSELQKGGQNGGRKE